MAFVKFRTPQYKRQKALKTRVFKAFFDVYTEGVKKFINNLLYFIYALFFIFFNDFYNPFFRDIQSVCNFFLF